MFLARKATHSDYVVGWNIATLSANVFYAQYAPDLIYSNTGVFVTQEQSSPNAIKFNNTGSKLYIVGFSPPNIVEYNLSENWNIFSRTFVSNANIRIYTYSPSGIEFSSDGSKMFITDRDGYFVQSYDLATPWVSNTLYPNTHPYYANGMFYRMNESFSVSTIESNPQSLQISADGRYMYVGGGNNQNINQYYLNQPWNVITASYVSTANVANVISAIGSTARYFNFKPDGTKMYVGGTGLYIYQFSLQSAWNVTSYLPDLDDSWRLGKGMFFTGNIFSLNTGNVPESNPQTIKIKDNGTKMYVLGTSSDSIVYYRLNQPWNVNTASFVSHFNVSNVTGESTPTGFDLSADGSKLFFVGQNYGNVYQYNLSENWNVSTAQIIRAQPYMPHEAIYYTGNSFNFSSQDGGPQTIRFDSTGTRLYMLGTSTDNVYQYNLSQAFNVTSATFYTKWDLEGNANANLNFTFGESDPRTFDIKPDGTKLWMVGASKYRIYEFDMLAPWEIKTLRAANSRPYDVNSVLFYTGNGYSLNSNTTINFPTDVKFRSDGLKMYVISSFNLAEFNLSQAWNVNTASYVSNIDIGNFTGETTARSIGLKSDGTSIFILGQSTGNVIEYSMSTPWSLNTAYVVAGQPHKHEMGTYFTGNRQSLNSSFPVNESSPRDFSFSHDGSRLYVIGTSSDSIIQYSLSQNWNVNTASFVTHLNVSNITGETTPVSFTISSNGTKMYMIGQNYGNVYEYTLSTPNLISTATNDRGPAFFPELNPYHTSNNLLLSSQDSNPEDFKFNPSGTRLYMMGRTTQSLYQYDLSRPWDISSATYTNNANIQISRYTTETSPYGFSFNNNGSRLFIVGGSRYGVFEFSLSTPYDLTTAVESQANPWGELSKPMYFKQNTFSVANQETIPRSTRFRPDGTRMYVVGTSSDCVQQYNLSQPYNVNTASFVSNVNLSNVIGEYTPYGVEFDSSGTRMIIMGSSLDLYEYQLSSAWNISTAFPTQKRFDNQGYYPYYTGNNFSVNSRDTNPRSLRFKDDGLKMYVLGDTNDRVYEFNLSQAWNVNTASYATEISVAAQDTSVQGLEFGNNGTRMYIIGQGNYNIYQYSLSTPWNVSTATYLSNRTFTNIDYSATGIYFKPDGLRMYTVSSQVNKLVEWNLTQAWNVQTASNIAETQYGYNLSDVAFNASGNVVYLSTTNSGSFLISRLSTAWSVNSLFTTNVFGITSVRAPNSSITVPNESSINSIHADPSSNSLFVLGSALDTVYELRAFKYYNYSTLGSNIVEYTPTNMFFGNTGRSLYVVGSYGTSNIHELSLNVAWDIDTISTSNISYRRFNLGSQMTSPADVHIDPSGTYAYVLGFNTKAIHVYRMNTAWNVGTMFFVTSNDNVLQYPANVSEPNPTSLTLDNTGTRIFITGSSSDRVTEYQTTRFFEVYRYYTAESEPRGITFDNSGLRMYIVGDSTNQIIQYSLSNIYDITTASQTTIYPAWIQGYTAIVAVNFTPTGNTMFITNRESPVVARFNLSQAWNVNTASYVSVLQSFTSIPKENTNQSISITDSSIRGFQFDSTGQRFYLIGFSTDRLYEFQTIKSFPLYYGSSPEYTPIGLRFSSDGTKMFIAGNYLDTVREYNLNSWNVYSANLVGNVTYNNLFNLGSDSGSISFANSGFTIYTTSSGNRQVYRRHLSQAWNVSSFVGSANNFGLDSAPTSNRTFIPVVTNESNYSAVAVDNSGLRLFMVGTALDTIHEYQPYKNLPLWNQGATGLGSLTPEYTPQGMVFKPDGTELYVTGSYLSAVRNYSLSSAWDLYTANYRSNISISQDTATRGLDISPSGNTMYIFGFANKRLLRYSLNTAWNTNTAFYVSATDNVMPQLGPYASESGLHTFVFDPTGSRIYGVGTNLDVVFEVRGIVTFDLTNFQQNPTGLTFSPDGTRMYVTGTSGVGVSSKTDQFDLSTPWNINSANRTNFFNHAVHSESPQDVFFHPAGNLMFAIGTSTQRAIRIPLLQAWNVNSYSSSWNTTASLSGVPTQNTTTFPSPTETNWRSITFDTTGQRMFVMGVTTDRVYEYQTQNAFALFPRLIYSPEDIDFRPDGLKMYITDSYNDSIFEYTLNTAWDTYTANFRTNVALSGFSIDQPSSTEFSPNGNLMMILNRSTGQIRRFNLSDAWNVNSYSYVSVTDSFGTQYLPSVGAGYNNLIIDDSGKRFYIADTSSDRIYEMNFNKIYDLNPLLSYTPVSINFRPQGNVMYVLDNYSSNLFQLNLSNSWEITSASYSANVNTANSNINQKLVTSGFGNWENQLLDFKFNADGTKLFFYGNQNKAITEFDLNVAYVVNDTNINFRRRSENLMTGSNFEYVEPNFRSFVFDNNGSNVYITGTNQDRVYKFGMGNFKRMVESPTFYYPQDIAFRPDGLAYFVLGFDRDIIQYTLTQPWNVTSVSNVLYANNMPSSPYGIAFHPSGNSFVVANNNMFIKYTTNNVWNIANTTQSVIRLRQTINGIRGVTFSNDGYRFDAIASSGPTVYSYPLTDGFYVGNQTTSPYDLFLSEDGTRMYISGYQYIFEYNLSIPYIVSSASYTGRSYDTTNQDLTPMGVRFRSDGLRMYIIGNNNDRIHQYNLSQAWNVQTASNVSVVSVSTFDLNPRGLEFSSDGTRMFFVGLSQDRVHQYNLSSPWEISSASYFGNISVQAQTSNPSSLFIRSDGFLMYISDSSDKRVNMYSLTDSYNVLSAAYVSNANVMISHQQEATPEGIFFTRDGNKFFVVGQNDYFVYSYRVFN